MGARFVACMGALTAILTACGSDVATGPSATDAAVDHCTDPLKNSPTTVNARELAFCQAEALGKLAGYVQEDTVDGQLATRSRANLDPLAVEIESFGGDGDAAGRVILVSGNTFVQRDGSWVQATSDSTDETLAFQSTLPGRYEALLNPNVRAAGTDPTLEYKVAGSDVVDGTPVTVLTLTVSDDADTLVSTLFIRDDYVVIRSESEYTVNGKESTRTATLTAVDEPQDIINPRFEDDEHRSQLAEPTPAGK